MGKKPIRTYVYTLYCGRCYRTDKHLCEEMAQIPWYAKGGAKSKGWEFPDEWVQLENDPRCVRRTVFEDKRLVLMETLVQGKCPTCIADALMVKIQQTKEEMSKPKWTLPPSWPGRRVKVVGADGKPLKPGDRMFPSEVKEVDTEEANLSPQEYFRKKMSGEI